MNDLRLMLWLATERKPVTSRMLAKELGCYVEQIEVRLARLMEEGLVRGRMILRGLATGYELTVVGRNEVQAWVRSATRKDFMKGANYE